MDDKITLEINNQIGTLTINRPEALNSFNWAMIDRFSDVITQCESEPLRALILTGVGRTFVAGGDITDHDTEETTGKRLATTMGDALRRMHALPYPVIAAVNAHAYGGGWEILTACDIRIMAEDATLNFVQAKMGLTSGWGGTPRLIQLVGASHAAYWLLSAQSISAQTAHSAGFIHEVVPKEAVLKRVYTMATRISALSGQAVSHLKQLIYEDLGTHYAQETARFLQAYTHPDHGRAVDAFLSRD